MINGVKTGMVSLQGGKTAAAFLQHVRETNCFSGWCRPRTVVRTTTVPFSNSVSFVRRDVEVNGRSYGNCTLSYIGHQKCRSGAARRLGQRMACPRTASPLARAPSPEEEEPLRFRRKHLLERLLRGGKRPGPQKTRTATLEIPCQVSSDPKSVLKTKGTNSNHILASKAAD